MLPFVAQGDGVGEHEPPFAGVGLLFDVIRLDVDTDLVMCFHGASDSNQRAPEALPTYC